MSIKNNLKKKSAFLLIAVMIVFIIATAGCVSNMTLVFHVDDEIYYQTPIDGKNTVELPDDPVKEGYIFKGWFFDEGTWEKQFYWRSLSEMPIASNVNVYAYFVDKNRRDDYCVIFDSKGGSFVRPVYVGINGKIDSPVNPTRGNDICVGWCTKDGDEWNFAKDIVTEDMTLYAKWQTENKAKYYLDGYNQTQLKGIESIYADNDGYIYITYYLAKIDGATLAVLNIPIVNTGGQKIILSAGKEVSDSISNSCSNAIEQSVGHSTTTSKESSHTIGDESKASLNMGSKASIKLGGTGVEVCTDIGLEHNDISSHENSFSKTLVTSQDTTVSQSKTEEFISNIAMTESRQLETDLSGYETGLKYRYVIKGNCAITKTFVFSTKDMYFVDSYYDCKVITGTPEIVLECSNSQDDFIISPIKLNNYDMDNAEVSQLFSGFDGSGTKDDPYQITNNDQFLLALIDQSQYYVLNNNIDLGSYTWITSEYYPNLLNLNGYLIGSDNPKHKDDSDLSYMVKDFSSSGSQLVLTYKIEGFSDVVEIIGSSGKEYTDFNIVIGPRTDNLTIKLNNFNFQAKDKSVAIDASKMSESATLTIDTVGCSSITGGDGINENGYVGVIGYNILVTGQGVLKIYGGNGGDGNDGVDGSNGNGGNGGDGNDGYNGGVGVLSYLLTNQIKDLYICGGDGGSGGNGGHGGNGINGKDGKDAFKGNNFAGYGYFIGEDGEVGGNGGNGGNGGDGGKGGLALSSNCVLLGDNVVSASGNQGNGGQGGNGGNGGVGGDGGECDDVVLHTNGDCTHGGKGGNGGNGGNGGDGGIGAINGNGGNGGNGGDGGIKEPCKYNKYCEYNINGKGGKGGDGGKCGGGYPGNGGQYPNGITGGNGGVGHTGGYSYSISKPDESENPTPEVRVTQSPSKSIIQSTTF